MIKLGGIVDLKALKPLNESTRSQIGVIDRSGNILSTYVHYDGYPKGVGAIAKKHYAGGKVKQLLKIDGGNGISSLEPKMDGGKGHSFDNRVKGQTTFYGRDRGEKGSMTMKYKNIEDFGEDFQQKYGAEYGYIWSVKNKKWTMFDYRGNRKEL